MSNDKKPLNPSKATKTEQTSDAKSEVTSPKATSSNNTPKASPSNAKKSPFHSSHGQTESKTKDQAETAHASKQKKANAQNDKEKSVNPSVASSKDKSSKTQQAKTDKKPATHNTDEAKSAPSQKRAANQPPENQATDVKSTDAKVKESKIKENKIKENNVKKPEITDTTKVNDVTDEHSSKASKGLATTALLVGLGGLGLSGYQLFNANDAQVAQQLNTMQTQVSDTDNALTVAKQARYSLDEKISKVSADVKGLTQTVASQPKTIGDSVTQSLSDTLGDTIKTSVMTEVNQTIEQAQTQFTATAKASEQKLTDTTTQFEQQVQRFGGQLSALEEAGVMSMNVKDIRNAQDTINSRVDTAFKNLTAHNVRKMQTLSDDIVREAEDVHAHFDEGSVLFANKTKQIQKLAAEAEQQVQLSKIGYLLDIAQNKVTYENAPEQAKSLLIDAKTALGDIEGAEAFSAELNKVISEFDAINLPNKTALFATIDKANAIVPTLIGKTDEVEVVATEQTGSLLDRFTRRIQSSVVEIPKDENAISITPESAEYARQNVKLNLNFIKYAIATNNQNLFQSNLTDLQNNLSVAFSENDALTQLNDIKAELNKVSLSASYPEMSTLQNHFTQLRQALNRAGEQQ